MRETWKKAAAVLLALSLTAALCAGCGAAPAAADVSAAYTDAAVPGLESADIAEEAVALSDVPALADTMTPTASGTMVKKCDKAVIDYSNTADGYVMVKFTAATDKKLKTQVKGPSGTTYTYNITAGGDYTTFPLSDGSGSYKVTVYENVTGNRYATVLSVDFSAALADAFAPFLRPNQYVNYTSAAKTKAKAAELCGSLTDPLDKVKGVYNYVVKTLTYDKQKAATVQSGYLPVLDTVLTTKKGICFDYASLMTAMLRSQGVPCKLVVGYAGTAYHAWISVWSKDKGWVDGVIYFDGTNWQRMDPTFASSGKQSASIMKYIGDGSHYTAKYLY